MDNVATTEDVIGPFIGRRIQRVVLKTHELHEPLEGPDKVVIAFDNGRELVLSDVGQSCCEQRFIHTDDDLASFVGARLVKVGTRTSPPLEDQEDEDEVHEVAFLVVYTSNGEMVFSTHNKHNGYYSGFCLQASTGDAVAPFRISQ